MIELTCCRKRRNGFECERYYTDEGEPAAVSPKRDLNSLLSMQQDDALNGPTLAFPPAETDQDQGLAMVLGEGPDKKPRKLRRRKEWVCEPDFQMSQGVVPHNIKVDPLKEWELPYQEYDPSDEDDRDDYSDLQLPPGWPHQ